VSTSLERQDFRVSNDDIQRVFPRRIIQKVQHAWVEIAECIEIRYLEPVPLRPLLECLEIRYTNISPGKMKAEIRHFPSIGVQRQRVPCLLTPCMSEHLPKTGARQEYVGAFYIPTEASAQFGFSEQIAVVFLPCPGV